jgi:hypothetical protein
LLSQGFWLSGALSITGRGSSRFGKRYETETLSHLRVRVFTPVPVASSVEQRFPLTQLRQFPVSVRFPTTLWLMGEYLALFSTGTGIHYCYQLHDPLLAESLRIIFKLLWGEL